MKSILLRLSIIVFVMAFFSCNNSVKEEGNTNADSTSSEVVNEDIGAIADAFPEIYHFISERDSSFSVDKFVEVSKDSMTTEQESAIGPMLKAYYPYFIFNTDSSFAIDLYSYNFDLVTENGK